MIKKIVIGLLLMSGILVFGCVQVSSPQESAQPLSTPGGLTKTPGLTSIEKSNSGEEENPPAPPGLPE